MKKTLPITLKTEAKPCNNYVLVNKKRVFENDNLETETLMPVEDQQSIQDKVAQETPKRLKLLNKDFNIIDIVSSEYFNETDKKEASTIASQKEQNTTSTANKITCNGVEMIREKVDAKSQEEKFVYDIYFTKSKDLHLDMLYSNNYEIKSSNYYDNIELIDEKNLVEGDEECKLFVSF